MNLEELRKEAFADPENLEKRIRYYSALQKMGKNLPAMSKTNTKKKDTSWINAQNLERLFESIDALAKEECETDPQAKYRDYPELSDNISGISINGWDELRIAWEEDTYCGRGCCPPETHEHSITLEFEDIIKKYEELL